MNLFTTLLIVAIAATASAVYYPPPETSPDVSVAQFVYQLKTFRQVLDECAEYLQVAPEAVDNLVANNYVTDDPNLKCLVRCAGINAGWWGVGGDSPGLRSPVIESYFQPACNDASYAKRTQECLDTKIASCQDDCSQAYESFLCYYHQYGNLKSSEEYVPVPKLDAIQAAVDCMLILRTPKSLLEQYSQGVVPVVPETKCLYRCQYLAEGLYDGVTLNLTRLYIRNYNPPAPQLLLPETQACVDSALNANCDECARVYEARACTTAYTGGNYTSGLLQAAAAIVLSHRTCDEEDLSPKYNAEVAPCVTAPPPPPPTPCPTPAPTPCPPSAPAPGCMYNCGP